MGASDHVGRAGVGHPFFASLIGGAVCIMHTNIMAETFDVLIACGVLTMGNVRGGPEKSTRTVTMASLVLVGGATMFVTAMSHRMQQKAIGHTF